MATGKSTRTGFMSELELKRRRRQILTRGGITLAALLILSVYLMPLAYGVTTSVKSEQQITDPAAPILPMDGLTYEYEGKEVKIYLKDSLNAIDDVEESVFKLLHRESRPLQIKEISGLLKAVPVDTIGCILEHLLRRGRIKHIENVNERSWSLLR